MKIIITLGLEGSGHHVLRSFLQNNDVPGNSKYNQLGILQNFVFSNIIDNKFLKTQQLYINKFGLTNNLEHLLEFLENNDILTINFSFPTNGIPNGMPNGDYLFKNPERRLDLFKLYDFIKKYDVEFVCFKRNLYDMYVSQKNRNIIDSLDNFLLITISNLSYLSMFIDFIKNQNITITIVDYNNVDTASYTKILQNIYPASYINPNFEFIYSSHTDKIDLSESELELFNTYKPYLKCCHNSGYFINF
jgi:hypothetical protein